MCWREIRVIVRTVIIVRIGIHRVGIQLGWVILLLGQGWEVGYRDTRDSIMTWVWCRVGRQLVDYWLGGDGVKIWMWRLSNYRGVRSR